MEDTFSKKRIAKNTLFLYIRMIFLIVISLYTSRVTLQCLGVEDYGIYNVVGGLVVMFSVISSTMSESIRRFLNYEMGKKDNGRLDLVFSLSQTIQILMSLILIILLETFGLWFLNYKMVIPPDRLVAANWVYQLSILSFVFGIISIPYNALIVAYEKMSVFAYISIFDGVAKLIVAFLIFYSPIDKLVYYSALITAVSIIVFFIYRGYCRRRIKDCSYGYAWDLNVFKELFGFASWNFIGAGTAILRDTGSNIVLNMFCGPAVNAARAISMQVNTAVFSFASNLTMAVSPQITKAYAAQQKDYMMGLVYQGTRFAYYLVFIISLPILCNTHFVLSVWLTEVPEHTVWFVRLIIIFALVETLSLTMITAQRATGQMKKYQLILGSINVLCLPIAYFLLYLGYPPESVFISNIIVNQITMFVRLPLLKEFVGLNIVTFLKSVYIKILIVTFLSCILPISYTIWTGCESWAILLISCAICVFSSSLIVLYIGCKKQERNMIFEIVKKKLNYGTK